MLDVHNTVEKFQAISLIDMEHVSLMNRIDTKFIGSSDNLSLVLNELVDEYKILEIDNCRVFPYKTEYFDTKEFRMYEDHQNGKLNRYKVRKREYVHAKQQYLEVKFKTNKGRTIKNRIKRDNEEFSFTDHEHDFLQNHSPFEGQDLESKLFNHFKRITLVGKTERVTIDFDLAFKDPEDDISISFPEIFILELKQEKFTLGSTVQKVLKENKIRSQSFSKYCMGTASINKEVKSNMLKQKFNLIKKIKAEFEN